MRLLNSAPQISVDRHVSQYVKIIYELRQEIEARKKDDSGKEAKVKAEERKDLEAGLTEVNAALTRLSSTKLDTCTKVYSSGRAQSCLTVLEDLRIAFRQWFEDGVQTFRTRSDLNDSQMHALDMISNFFDDLARIGQQLQPVIGEAEKATTFLQSQMTFARQRLRHAAAIDIFERECRAIQHEVDAATASGREQGRIDSFSTSMRGMSIVCEARLHLGSQNLSDAEALERATARLFEGISNSSPDSAPASTSCIPGAKIGLSPKRGQSSRLSTQHLPAANIHSSAAKPPFKVQSPQTTRRSSPDKVTRIHDNVSTGASPQRKKAKKSVLWRDEAGQGWDLEDSARSAADESTNSVEKANSSAREAAPPPAGPRPRSSMVTQPRPSVAPRLAANTARSSVGSNANLRPKTSNRMRAGFLGSKRLSVIADEHKASPQPAARPNVSNDSANSSSNSINSSFDNSSVHHTRSSFLKAAAAGRRMSSMSMSNRRSSIGPVKSLKTSRRGSQASQTGSENDSFEGAGRVRPVASTRSAGRASVLPGAPETSSSQGWK